MFFDPENKGLAKKDLEALGGEQRDFNGIGTNGNDKITFRELISLLNRKGSGDLSHINRKTHLD